MIGTGNGTLKSMATSTTKVTDNSSAYLSSLEKAIGSAMSRVALDVLAESQQSLQSMVYDLPENPRRPRTGNLMASLTKRSGKTWAEVEATASYAMYVHDGNQYMSPRPFLTEGGKRALRKSSRRVREALSKAGLI